MPFHAPLRCRRRCITRGRGAADALLIVDVRAVLTCAGSQMLFYVMMCGLCGALTVTSAKGVSIALTALVAGRSLSLPPPTMT